MTSAIVYKNTKTAIRNWVDTIHREYDRGMAYETATHFVHFYGRGNGLWVVSTRLTATERKAGTITDWVTRVFGADQIRQATNQAGRTVAGVWRPALNYQEESLQALAASESEQRAAEQALRLLVERLDELFLYIEPDSDGLKAYSHKTRELLILACTEVENTWKHYMRTAGVTPTAGDFSTKDYVRLLGPLYLPEYEVSLKPYAAVPATRPFLGWDAAAPTKSLPWYDAYNKTKHDRTTHFPDATLRNCIVAIAANLVLFCVRFSPFPLFQGVGTLSSLVNHLFKIELRDPDPASLYVPLISPPTNIRENLVCGQSKDWIQKWVVRPLTI